MARDHLTPASALAARRDPLFPNESPEYAKERNALLAEEIEFRRHEVRLAEQRRALPPGPVVDKDWRFKDDQGVMQRSSTCSVITTRSSLNTGCTAQSGSGPARCARTCSARLTATPPTFGNARRSRSWAAPPWRGNMPSRRSAAGMIYSSSRPATITPAPEAVQRRRDGHCGAGRLPQGRRQGARVLGRRGGVRLRRSRRGRAPGARLGRAVDGPRPHAGGARHKLVPTAELLTDAGAIAVERATQQDLTGARSPHRPDRRRWPTRPGPLPRRSRSPRARRWPCSRLNSARPSHAAADHG